MISKNKEIALLTFVHSRLSGKYTDKQDIKGNVIPDKNTINTEISKIVKYLDSNGYTVDKLNNMIDCYYASLITYYYEVALKTMSKYIKDGEYIIEGVIAISILSYLIEEKQVTKLDIKPSDLLQDFEKANNDRDLVFRMIDIGTKIVESVDKANYTQRRKNSKKRKKR